jgi:hypothetical protein
MAKCQLLVNIKLIMMNRAKTIIIEEVKNLMIA